MTSSTAGHTRAPWRSQGWVPTWAYIPVHDADHNLVASLYPNEHRGYSRDQVEANARLIAAAPELLAALIGVVAVADRETDEFIRARAAIAAAKGGA